MHWTCTGALLGKGVTIIPLPEPYSLVPYLSPTFSAAGSFVSGLYTPRGDLDLSIEGMAMW